MSSLLRAVRCIKCFDAYELTDTCKFNCVSERKIGSSKHCEICERVGKKKLYCNCGCGRLFTPTCRWRYRRAECWHATNHISDPVTYSMPQVRSTKGDY